MRRASRAPAAPPAPAFREKAPWKTLATARGMFSRNTHSTHREAPKNSRVIRGTKRWVIFAPRASPPRATQKASSPSPRALAAAGTPRGERDAAAAWVWAMVPMPREERQHPPAYTAARGFPHRPAARMYPKAPGACRWRAARTFSA